MISDLTKDLASKGEEGHEDKIEFSRRLFDQISMTNEYLRQI